MAHFFDSLGAAAVSRQQDATAAMSTVLRRYAELSAQGERLRQVLVAGGKVPCAVWDAYNRACTDYIVKSQPLFNQLAQKGVDVDQVVYSGGQPVLDPAQANAYKTLRVSAPLRPPAFTFIAAECPQAATFQGAIDWTPFPIDGGQLGAVGLSTLATMGASMIFVLSASGNPIGAVGYSSYKALKAISVWMSEYDPPSQILAAFTDCVDRLTKSGLSPASASSQCAASQASAQQYSKDRAEAASWGFWSWVGVGTAVLVVGGGLALYARHRLSRVAGLGGIGDGSLADRIAAALGWPVRDVRSMSLQTVRELVRPVDRELAAEISSIVSRGAHVTWPQAEAQARNREAARGEDARMYNRDLDERIRNKPFRVSRY